MKGLFAAVVIIMVGMLSFLMKYDEIGERLALTSSTLVGAILYHLTLTASIPPVGYMTRLLKKSLLEKNKISKIAF